MSLYPHYEQSVVHEPFTNVNSLFEMQDGEMRKGMGGSCRQKLDQLASDMHAEGLETLFLPSDRMGSVHFILACAQGGQRELFDPTRRWKTSIPFPDNMPVGDSITIAGFPDNKTITTSVTLTRESEAEFSTMNETRTNASSPHTVEERHMLENGVGVLPPPIFDALTTALREKLELIAVQKDTGDVIELSMNPSKPDAISIKKWGEARVRRKKSEEDFLDLLQELADSIGSTPEAILAFFEDGRSRLNDVLELLGEESGAIAEYQKQRDERLEVFRATGNDVPDSLMRRADMTFSMMRAYLGSKL